MYPYKYGDYDNSISGVAQQHQSPATRYTAGLAYPQSGSVAVSERPPQLKGEGQKPKTAARMPKAQAVALAEKMKKGVIVAALLTFGTFSGLVAYRQGITTTTKAASQAPTKSSATPIATATQDSSSGYFNQGSSTNANSGSSSSSSASTDSNSGSSSASTSNNSGSSSTTTAPSTSTTTS